MSRVLRLEFDFGEEPLRLVGERAVDWDRVQAELAKVLENIKNMDGKQAKMFNEDDEAKGCP